MRLDGLGTFSKNSSVFACTTPKTTQYFQNSTPPIKVHFQCSLYGPLFGFIWPQIIPKTV